MKRIPAFSIKISIFSIVYILFLTISLLSTEKAFAVEFAGGSGTIADPYIITTTEQLDAVRNNLTAYYKLGADIDLSAYENWVPIGYDYAHRFRGGFNGDGHIISNLTINRPDEFDVGLFGEVDYSSVISNVTATNVKIVGYDCVGTFGGYCGRLENCHVTGDIYAIEDYAGGLAGYCDRGISNCSMTGTVRGGSYVGGLFGERTDSSIVDSYFIGSVTGEEYVGGLLGTSSSCGIYNCYVNANITGEKYTGGLKGCSDANIYESYMIGSVNGVEKTGGLVGYQVWRTQRNVYSFAEVEGETETGGLFGAFTDADLLNGYAAGQVRGTDNATTGGLIGTVGVDYTITSAYYDTNITGQTDTGKGEPKTTAEMQVPGTFAGWDFVNTWTIDPYKNYGYPYLQWQGELPSQNANLANLVLNCGGLDPLFAAETTAYGVEVGNETATITLTPILADDQASLVVKLDGEDVAADEDDYEIVLSCGTNTVEITVTAEDEEITKTYTVEVRRDYSAEANLAGLSISNGVLNPGFAAEQTDYVAQVSYRTRTVQLTPVLADSKASLTVSVNGEEIAGEAGNYEASLKIGLNNVVIDVTAEDGTTTQQYILEINRAKKPGSGTGNVSIPTEDNDETNGTENPNEVEDSAEGDIFEDIQGHWAEKVIKELASKQLVSGVAPKNFCPDTPIKRAEFAAMMVRILGLEAKVADNLSTSFSDVKTSDWAYLAIRTAQQYDLMNGCPDGSFRPEAFITREEAMAVLAQALALREQGVELTPQEMSTVLTQYADGSEISEWAKTAVALSVQKGLIVGRDNSLAPQASITRAESAAVIWRFLQQRVKLKPSQFG